MGSRHPEEMGRRDHGPGLTMTTKSRHDRCGAGKGSSSGGRGGLHNGEGAPMGSDGLLWFSDMQADGAVRKTLDSDGKKLRPRS